MLRQHDCRVILSDKIFILSGLFKDITSTKAHSEPICSRGVSVLDDNSLIEWATSQSVNSELVLTSRISKYNCAPLHVRWFCNL